MESVTDVIYILFTLSHNEMSNTKFYYVMLSLKTTNKTKEFHYNKRVT